MSKAITRAIALCLVAALSLGAQSLSLADVYAQIRAEETNNSKIMWLIHQITDVQGRRVTGSPQLKAASDWAVKTLTSWGLTNAKLEPWTFQPPSAATPVPGWDNLELSADVIKPYREQLMVKPIAWTPSTKGPVTSEVALLLPPGLARPGAGFAGQGGPRAAQPAAAPALPPPVPAREQAAPPQQPTRAELDAYLNSMKDRVKGRIVMVGPHVNVPINMTPAPLRRSDEQWRAQFDPTRPAQSPFGGGGQPPQLPEGQLRPQDVARIVDQFLVDNGALVRINDAGRAHGIIIAQQNNTYDWTRVVPTLVMRNEDYGRIYRLVSAGTPVTLRVNIKNELYPAGTTAYNVTAEIPGSDKADEVVMLGGHFDSWHGATGATDNGVGCAMMMEAVRILAALKLQPRRTIRIALWSGEEQGLLGSIAYVEQHFGSFEKPKPEFAKLSAYFNIDSGTSKPRGASVFGPAAAADMIREALMPYKDWGFTGVRATNSRRTGGTDSTSFNNAGLPGIGLSQDPFDYGSYTHHTNLDTYERIYEEDVRMGAVMIASAVYAVAMAENLVPRFAATDMPAPAPPPAPGSTAVPRETPPAKAAKRSGNN